MPHAFSRCPTCKFEYEVEERDEHRTSRLLRFRCLLLRDTCALFLATQLVLSLVSVVLHAADSGGAIPRLYPHRWAERQEKVHLAIGPYYVSAVILCLALLGMLGTYLRLTNQLPAPPTRPAAARHRVDTSCCPRCCQFYPGEPLLFCDCEPCCRVCCCADHATCGACECGACLEGGGACECGACDLASGGELILPVLLILLLLFAAIGLFVGIFFATIVVQRAAQKHVYLLQMRSEAQRFVVVDRAERPPTPPSAAGRDPAACGARANTMQRAPDCQHTPHRGCSQCYPGPARDV